MSYIRRSIEEVLLSKSKTSKSIAITGARQVGKTTMTSTLFPEVSRINLKNPSLLLAAKDDPQLFLESYERPLFIDEIQKAPELIESAKVVLDKVGGKFNYVFSGSQKWSLMKGLSDSLSGMVSILELSTLSMREVSGVCFNEHFVPNDEYIAKREKTLKNYGDIWQYIHNGMYPELYDDNPRGWEEFYSDYVKTYIERDVYDITKVRDYMTFYRFLVSVAARTGNVLDYTNISNDVGVSVDTVKMWVGILEKTDIVYLLQPYYNSHLNRVIKSPKIYFRDTGLAAYLTSWTTPKALENGAMNGAFFETFAIGEILKSFSNEGKDYRNYVYYYKGKDKKKNKVDSGFEECEVDLIIEENGTLYPIEIKKNSNPKSEMASAFPVLDKDIGKKRGTGAIVCRCEHKMKLRDNLYALPIEYI
ncbi:MAG: DUF4143 domain-containing protein [Bacilli bacterium]|nr:DUF4143 domain-containing protein [Bacilli bacterium]